MWPLLEQHAGVKSGGSYYYYFKDVVANKEGYGTGGIQSVFADEHETWYKSPQRVAPDQPTPSREQGSDCGMDPGADKAAEGIPSCSRVLNGASSLLGASAEITSEITAEITAGGLEGLADVETLVTGALSPLTRRPPSAGALSNGVQAVAHEANDLHLEPAT